MTRLLPLFLLFTTIHALATCFYPDGITTDPNHVPCNQTTTSASACCDPLDSCSESGICLGRSGWTYRGSCTDVTWGSENCPAKAWDSCITDPSSGTRYNSFTAIWSCSPIGTPESDFCCGYENGSSCCDSSFQLGVTGVAFKPGFDAFVANLAKQSTDNNNSSGSNAGIVNNNNNNTGGNDDLGMKVGLGVGIPLGVLVLGLLGWLAWRETRKGKGKGESYGVIDQVGSPVRKHSGGPVGGYANSSYTADNGSVAGTTMPPYSPQPKGQASLYNPQSPVYEAPPSGIHEMRG